MINSQISPSLIVDDREESIPQTWEERAFYIIKELILGHTAYLDLFELCDNLCISYSTVKAVISRMNKTFASYQVEFNTVHLVLLMAINKADKKNFRLLYEALISQFGEDTMIQEVRNCASFQKFEALIYHNIQQENV